MPSRSLLTMASSKDSTMAASLSVGSGGRMVIAPVNRGYLPASQQPPALARI
jgi:hypothetical protein